MANPLMKNFLAWCREELNMHRGLLEAMEKEGMRTGTLKPGEQMRDTTQESISHSRRVIAEMERILADHQ